MAIILKEGKTFNPERVSKAAGMDMSHGNYYAIIKQYEYDAEREVCAFQIKIFGSKQIREDGGPHIETMQLNINPDDFGSKVGYNGISIAECYSLALEQPVFIDWQSDEL